MSSKKRGLGKGLNELLSATLSSKSTSTEAVLDEKGSDQQILHQISVEKLVRGEFQPRQQMSQEGLEQLAESIRVQGLMQPIVVRKKGKQYEIIAGERRWRASQLAGLATVPVIIRDVPDEAAMAMALIENIQRENLNPIEEAIALKRLADELQLTHLQVAEAIGKSRASVTNLLRLLALEEEVQILLAQNKIEMGHARAILSLKGQAQVDMALMIVEKQLSVRETESLIQKMHNPVVEEKIDEEIVVVDPNIRRLEEDLADKLGAQLYIRHTNRGKGKLVIQYNNVDELEGILAHFK